MLKAHNFILYEINSFVNERRAKHFYDNLFQLSFQFSLLVRKHESECNTVQ